jgi:hypothetical protein
MTKSRIAKAKPAPLCILLNKVALTFLSALPMRANIQMTAITPAKRKITARIDLKRKIDIGLTSSLSYFSEVGNEFVSSIERLFYSVCLGQSKFGF